MSELTQLPADAAVIRTRPVVPPLPLRAAAYLIDIVVLYFLGYTLETFLRDQLLALGPLLPFLSTFLMFLYFWLGNGPIGKGATFGKSILNMHTVRLDGGIPGWKQSFERALLHFPPVYTATFLLFRDGLQLPELWTSPIGALLSTFTIFLFAVNGFSMLMHPFRRGLHDRSGDVMVTSDPTPLGFAEAAETLSDPQFAVQFRPQRNMLFFFGAVIALILSAQWTLALLNPEMRMEMRAVDAFNRELDLGEYRVAQIGIPTIEDVVQFRDTVAKVAANPPQGMDIPTTDTLRRFFWRDGETAVLRIQKRFGTLRDKEVQSEDFDALLHRVREGWNELAQKLNLTEPPARPAATRIIITAADPFQFAFFPPRQGQLNAWFAEAPIDAALGGFKLEKMKFEQEKKPVSPAAPSDTPTTGTQTGEQVR